MLCLVITRKETHMENTFDGVAKLVENLIDSRVKKPFNKNDYDCEIMQIVGMIENLAEKAVENLL